MIVPYKEVERMVDYYLPDDIKSYHWGNEYELKEFLSVKTKTVYPLLWFVLPNGDGSYPKQKPWMETEINLFLATTTKLSWLNPQREVETFEQELNPIVDKLIEMFIKSNNVQVLSDNFISNALPNYYQEGKKNQSNNYWDVRTLKFQGRVFHKQCLTELTL